MGLSSSRSKPKCKKMAGRRQKEHFLAITVFSLHRPEDLGLGLLSSKNFKARLLDFACEQRDFERFGLSHHQMLKISAPLGTFYLTVDLWRASLQLSFKEFSITWAHEILKQHSKLTYYSWGRRSGTFTVCSAQSTAVGDSVSLQNAPFSAHTFAERASFLWVHLSASVPQRNFQGSLVNSVQAFPKLRTSVFSMREKISIF